MAYRMEERKERVMLAGHPRFYELTKLEDELHSRKNHDYAAGGSPTGNFERVAKLLSMYPHLALARPGVVAMVYMMKQLDAALWFLNTGNTSVTGEGVEARLADVSVYAKLARIMFEEEVTKVPEQEIDWRIREHKYILDEEAGNKEDAWGRLHLRVEEMKNENKSNKKDK